MVSRSSHPSASLTTFNATDSQVLGVTQPARRAAGRKPMISHRIPLTRHCIRLGRRGMVSGLRLIHPDSHHHSHSYLDGCGTTWLTAPLVGWGRVTGSRTAAIDTNAGIFRGIEKYVCNKKPAGSITYGSSIGGGGGIRTHEGLSPLLVFKTSAFNRSATPPTDAIVAAHAFRFNRIGSHFTKNIR